MDAQKAAINSRRPLWAGWVRSRQSRAILRLLVPALGAALLSCCLLAGGRTTPRADAVSVEDLLAGGICGRYDTQPPATPLPPFTPGVVTRLSNDSLNTFTRINWAGGANCPVALSESQTAMIDGSLFVFGGFDYPVGPITRSQVYEPSRNKWYNVASMPQKLTHVGVALIGGNVYLAGGYVGFPEVGYGQTFGSVDCYVYSANTNRYSSLPSFPVARSGGALVAVGNVLHYFGGFNLQGRTDSNLHYTLNLSESKARWTLSSPMPLTRNHMAYVYYGNKVYLIAGQIGHDAGLTCKADVQIYDPFANRWGRGASMPRAVSHISNSTFVMGDRILVLGGETANGIQTADCFAYTPATNRWQQLTSLPAARLSGVARTVNNKIIFTCGGNDSNTWIGTPE